MSSISLTKLKQGSKARVIEIKAGKQSILRLSAIGIRPGVHLTKTNAFALRGPVTVKVHATTIALGHGMAEKVIVESHA